MPRINQMFEPASQSLIASREIRIDSFEQLRAATPTSNAEIIQIEAGRMQGRLKHATVAGLSLGFGTFSRGLISRGVYSGERVTIGFLFESRTGRSRPIGNIRFWPPGMEHERRYLCGESFGALSVSVNDMASSFGPDSRFSEPLAWKKAIWLRPDCQAAMAAANGLRKIMACFESRTWRISEPQAEYWKRAILDTAATAIEASDATDAFISSPVKLVRKVQDYIDERGAEPVHISELSSHLRVSRRSLHRAFDDVLGVAPTTYLRHKRLCQARATLNESVEPVATVAEVAFRFGFSDLGRFSGYYRSLFGENPSDTLRQSRLKAS
jgi:AraC family ethanolamine operon transcriptional activator